MSTDVLPDLKLETSTGRSRIVVEAGSMAQLGQRIVERWPMSKAIWLISDTAVLSHHGAAVEHALRTTGRRVHVRAVPVGEATKNLSQVSELYDWLLAGSVTRGDVVVALGGGMVGDLAGYVAATCLRGLPLVQAPTSLLAMVDSSVGGKTGVNHVVGKNLIGAFYQPALVVVDPDVLATLPSRERASGWAEIIKYALIEGSVPDALPTDHLLLDVLDVEADQLAQLRQPLTASVIHRCIELKTNVVRVDPTEQGLRAILNYGHTAGHAVEAAAGYGAVLHGEAVALGMRVAAGIAQSTGRCDASLVERQQALIRRFSLPETVAKLTIADLWPYMRRDKKAVAGALRWILPTMPGTVEIADGIDESTVNAALGLIVEATGA